MLIFMVTVPIKKLQKKYMWANEEIHIRISHPCKRENVNSSMFSTKVKIYHKKARRSKTDLLQLIYVSPVCVIIMLLFRYIYDVFSASVFCAKWWHN